MSLLAGFTGQDGDAASVGAVVLAAGAATRFGALKQLARLQGRPLIAHALHAAEALPPLSPIVVVLGADAEQVRAGLPAGRHRAVVCDAWRDGLAASLRYGVQALGPIDAVLVLLADQPLVDQSLVRRVLVDGLPRVLAGTWPQDAPIAACHEAPDAARPVAAGVPGHPVLLGPGALARLHAVRGDHGLGAVLPAERVHAIAVDGPAATLDVDVPADLLRAEAHFAAAPGAEAA